MGFLLFPWLPDEEPIYLIFIYPSIVLEKDGTALPFYEYIDKLSTVSKTDQHLLASSCGRVFSPVPLRHIL